jgi:hypothetical protein
MDREMTFWEFFRVSRDIFQSINFSSNSFSSSWNIHKKELIKKTKHDNIHKLSSWLSQDYCMPTACRAEFKVPIVPPHDIAEPV